MGWGKKKGQVDSCVLLAVFRSYFWFEVKWVFLVLAADS